MPAWNLSVKIDVVDVGAFEDFVGEFPLASIPSTPSGFHRLLRIRLGTHSALLVRRYLEDPKRDLRRRAILSGQCRSSQDHRNRG